MPTVSFRWIAVWALTTLAALPLLASLALDSGSRATIRDGLVADWGTAQFAAQVPPGSQYLFASMPDAVGVQLENGVASAGDRASTARRRILFGGASDVGRLVTGRRALHSSETVLSVHAARALGARVGDPIIWTADDRPATTLTVVGLLENPAALDESILVSPATSDTRPSADYWLLRHRPTSRALTGVQLASFATEVSDRTERAIAPWRRHVQRAAVPLLVAFGAIALIVVASSSLTFTNRRKALAATSASVTSGVLTASALVLAATPFVRVADDSGQHWPTLLVPIPLLASTIVAALTLGVATVRLAPWTAAVWCRATERHFSSMEIICISITGISVLAATVVAARSPGASSLLLPLAGASVAVVAGSVAALVGNLGAHRRQAASTPIASSAAIVALATLGAFVSSWIVHDVRVLATTEDAQPRGSYVVMGASDRAATTLMATFRSNGGEAVRAWSLPDESRVAWRASSKDLLTCLAAQHEGGRCWESHPDAPLEMVAVDADMPAGSTPIAAPWVLSNGRVTFGLLDQHRPVLAKVETVSSAAEESLGGNLPGLILPPDTARGLGWEISSTDLKQVAFMDFDELQDPVTMQRLVDELAPAAQVGDDHALRALVADGVSHSWWVSVLASVFVSAAAVFTQKRNRGTVPASTPFGALLGSLLAACLTWGTLRSMSQEPLHISPWTMLPLLVAAVTGGWIGLARSRSSIR